MSAKRVVMGLAVLAVLCGFAAMGFAAAKEETTVFGHVSKVGKDFIIEAEEGDYIVKGKDLSKYLNTMVEANGYVTKSSRGLVLEVISVDDASE